MLANFPIHPVIPAQDIARARRWYAEKLDLHPTREDGAELFYNLRNSSFLLYQTTYPTNTQTTVAEWDVGDLDALMADMRARGVVFEEYDLPKWKTVNGVAALENFRTAWFKDSEGNIIALSEFG